jgi:hypothetical protein
MARILLHSAPPRGGWKRDDRRRQPGSFTGSDPPSIARYREANAPGNLPVPPILTLRDAGVTVFAGNDDIRDSWWPDCCSRRHLSRRRRDRSASRSERRIRQEGLRTVDYDVVFERAKLADGTVGSIGVKAGRIAAISTDAPLADAVQRIDLEHLLVVPGLIDGHIHLDKSFIGDEWKPHRPRTAGFDVRERVAFEKAALAPARSVEHRAAGLIELAISHGTMHVRTHVDIDPEVGLRNLEAVLTVKERYRNMVAIEVVPALRS